MIHVDEGTLQALVDDELDAEGRSAAELHLDACALCRAELDAIRSASRELAGALSLLDHRVPRARDYALAMPRRPPQPRMWRQGRSLARAAVLVFGFAAAASATIPGSPVRRWLGDLVAPAPAPVAVSLPAEARDAPPPAAPEATVMAAPVEAGISVLPAGGEVTVVLRDASPGLLIRAVLVDGERAGAFAVGEAASARFQTAPGRIEVLGAGAGELRIELPRSAYNATVVVDGAPYLAKQGDRMSLAVAARDSAGAEVTFQVPPR